MIKKIFIEEEILESIEKGKHVEGSIRKDAASGKLCFKAYVRKRNIYGRKPDKVLCQLPNGWLKESAQRIKFFTSQKKEMGKKKIIRAMEQEFDEAIKTLAKRREVKG